MPKYYDEQKEKFGAMTHKGQDGDNPSSMKARISAANSRNRSYSKGVKTRKGSSTGMTVRVFLIIGALILITYILLGLYLPTFDAYLN